MLDIVDLLARSRFDVRSSIVLTYSLDLPLYDGLIRRVLNRSGVWNQMVFCDFRCFLKENQVHSGDTYAGKHYSITPILQTGAFHPKVYMLLGPKHGRMLIGSGNATIGGLLKNAELFSLFDYDADVNAGPHSAFSQVFRFAEGLTLRASKTVRNQIKTAHQIAKWLDLPPIDDGRKVLIGGPGHPKLFAQVVAQLKTKKVDDLVFCSSSFDRSLGAIRRLVSLSKSKPVCIVQPDNIALDGKEVQKLGGSIAWRPFVDPYPKERSARKDFRAHAKLFVFGKGNAEICIVGSANASEPAFALNSEIVVALTAKKGETLRRLGLNASLKAKSVESDLSSKKWQPKEEDPVAEFQCLLSAVSASQTAYEVTLASGSIPNGSLLTIAGHSSSAPMSTSEIRGSGNLYAAKVGGKDSARTAWIEDRRGKRISNVVTITWPEVAMPRKGVGGNSKASKAMLAVQDGSYLGTVLFELLDQFRDFEVIRAGTGGGRSSNRREQDEKLSSDDALKPAEFFYTDQPSNHSGHKHWSGDRVDLDILASLVQPLTGIGNRVEKSEDAYDDTKLEEEAEHRKMTEQQRAWQEEEEPKSEEALAAKKLGAAIRRLERRLIRAADSLESSLGYLDNLKTIPPNGIARQVWMTHIGAFLAGRKEKSAEGDEYICLKPWRFAEYVLRIGRSLVGSKKTGGFLDRLESSAWEGYDGEAMKKGLAFLWTCMEWAAGYTVHFYTSHNGTDEEGVGLAVGSAELVAARFIAKVRRICDGPDRANLEKRFPGWFELPVGSRLITTRRLNEICQLIDTFEAPSQRAELGDESMTQSLKAGMLVYNSVTGVTMLATDAAPGEYRLVNLSRPGNAPQKFVALVAPVLLQGSTYQLFQRTDFSPAA